MLNFSGNREAFIPNNYFAAAQQFKKIKTRYLNDSNKFAVKQDTITNNLTRNYFHKLPSEEIPSTDWILPEHGMTKPNARWTFQSVCLNDKLLSGPDLLSNLTAVICRFRERKCPIKKYIEECTCKFPSDPQTKISEIHLRNKSARIIRLYLFRLWR